MFRIPEFLSKINFLLGESTVLGVSHAARAYRDHLTFRTVFWSVITVVSTGFTGWACYLVLDDYLSYPVVSVLETKLNKILEFPSVAFCNLNPVPCRSLFERSLDYPLLWEESGCSMGKQTNAELTTILVTYQKLYGKIPPQYDVLTTKTDLLNFLAYTFVDSVAARAVVYDANMTTLLQDLESFLLVYFSPAKMVTKKDAAMRYHITNLMQLAKNHVWYVQVLTPLIKKNFATINVTNSRNDTTLLVLLRAYRDATIAEGTFDYGVYTASGAVGFWQDWETAVFTGSPPAVTVPQKLIVDKASYGFSTFINKTVSVISRNPMFGTIPFLYTESIMPALIAAIQRNAVVMNQQLDAALQKVIDKLTFYAGSMAKAFPTTAELISSKSGLTGDVFTDMFIQLPVQEQQTMGLTFGQFFLSCSFKGVPCVESDFVKFMNTKYGQCFYFNSGMKKSKQEIASGANTSVIGVAGGLSVKLNIEDDQYIRSGFKETSGARIAIMPPRTPPNVFDSGYSVPPGQEVNFELRQSDNERLPNPYPSNCIEFWNETAYGIYNLDYDYKACLRFCLIHEIYAECQCVEQGYIKEFTINGMGLDYVPYCLAAARDNQSACVERIKSGRQSASGSKFQCSCKPACIERDYEVVTSSALYPSLAYSGYMGSKFNIHELTIEQNWEMLKRNYGKVNVYFAAFDSLSTREEAKYSVFSLAGNVGGAASLMLGFCGVTILEVILLIWDIGLDCVSKRKNGASGGDAVEEFDTKSAMGQKNPVWGMPVGPSGKAAMPGQMTPMRPAAPFSG